MAAHRGRSGEQAAPARVQQRRQLALVLCRGAGDGQVHPRQQALPPAAGSYVAVQRALRHAARQGLNAGDDLMLRLQYVSQALRIVIGLLRHDDTVSRKSDNLGSTSAVARRPPGGCGTLPSSIGGRVPQPQWLSGVGTHNPQIGEGRDAGAGGADAGGAGGGGCEGEGRGYRSISWPWAATVTVGSGRKRVARASRASSVRSGLWWVSRTRRAPARWARATA